MIKKILFYNIIFSYLIICQANTYNNIFNIDYLKIKNNNKQNINQYSYLNNNDICFKNDSLKYNLFNSYINKNLNKQKYFIENNSDNYDNVWKDLIKHEYINFKKAFTTTLNVNDFLSYYGF